MVFNMARVFPPMNNIGPLAVETYIRSLFANGESGVAINRTLSASYQDHTATTPADDTDDLVEYIEDLSGNSNPLTAANDAGRVVLTPTGWQFNGSSQYLLNHAIAAVVSGEDRPVSVIQVAQVLDGAGTNRVAWSFGSSANTTSVYYLLGTTLNQWRRDKQQTSGGGTLSSNALDFGAGLHLNISVDNGVGHTMYSGGAQTNAVTQDTGAITVNRFVVGARIRQATVDLYFPMLLNTLIVVGRALTAQEIAHARALFA